MKKNLIDISTIFKYSNLLASETLSFFIEIFAKIFFVIRYSIVSLNDNKKKCKFNISIDEKSFELVIVSA